eukprot:m.90620 g.90620  ORF g.90620 m.90620 type:complete len:365 (+) comp26412_c3_seq1:140-1234(+)
MDSSKKGSILGEPAWKYDAPDETAPPDVVIPTTPAVDHFELDTWRFTPDVKTPTQIEGKIDAEKEARYRKEGAEFIKKLATSLKLHSNVYFTGIVFYHRFYNTYTFSEYPRWYMAGACLFVAGKVEEQPKKLTALLPVIHQLYPRRIKSGDPIPQLSTKQYGELKIRILANERILLQTLKFDLMVDHPSQYLLKYARGLKLKSGDKLPNELVQQAYTCIVDIYKTVLCIEYRPEILAVAVLNLACILRKTTVVPQECNNNNPQVRKWWEYFGQVESEQQIQTIQDKLIRFYETTGSPMGLSSSMPSPMTMTTPKTPKEGTPRDSPQNDQPRKRANLGKLNTNTNTNTIERQAGQPSYSSTTHRA